MPWTEKQHKLFQVAAHNPEIAQKVGLSQTKAKKMASEGVKHDPKKLARVLTNGKA